MQLDAHQLETVATEVKRFATDLNLSDQQKQQFQDLLKDAYNRLQEYKHQTPNASTLDIVKKVADNRAELRQRVQSFLTPDQLTKWDSEAAKAKEFLGLKTAA